MSPALFDLTGKLAVVTGAKRGIGRAMAEAFRSGRLGVMDYYKMENVQADTMMRETIGGGENSSRST